ncbi:MAG: HypC/HybG/HupF family hydrogenase formation chaperone [Austwickia sp.]|jgi:hydrogenase expression/formation protein HypC|nr:HypC/HybG/HupF family hydrogenase formation chaperone [Austwickia sp.]MBK8435072.1 HypC/HybG/HupF family hydrogenase formation chaperone [Austwickia sp.]MBK9101373.1 HypC/HybG/HupF family hydrogenase formation chaperone [Austwickia sp.]
MCLAMPALVVELVDPAVAPHEAIVELDGVRKQISIALVDDVQVGDYVILHVGFALQKLDVEEAEATLRLFAELAAAEGQLSAPMAPTGAEPR